jgi:hypothetical protein
MTDPNNTTDANTAAICMAIQHLLIKKGVCSYNELVEANGKAQKVLEKIYASVSDESGNINALHESVKDMLMFIGGEEAMPSLEAAFARAADLTPEENE